MKDYGFKIPPKNEIRKWVAALRSGNYKQGRNMLYSADGNSFCCLGVAASECIGAPTSRMSGRWLPAPSITGDTWVTSVSDDFRARTNAESLVVLNDSAELSFDEIADCLELVYIHEALED